MSTSMWMLIGDTILVAFLVSLEGFKRWLLLCWFELYCFWVSFRAAGKEKKKTFLVLKTYYSNKYFDGKHLPCTLLCTQHGSDIWVLRWVSGSFREFWNFTEKCHLISKFQLRTKISEPWSVSQKRISEFFFHFSIRQTLRCSFLK